MKIVIKNKNLTSAVIITVRANRGKFESDYERIKFFKELHGWNQTVPGERRKYVYRRSGLLDEVPHVRLADSVFAVAMEHMKQMEQFFSEWEEKVDFEIMEIMTNRKMFVNTQEYLNDKQHNE
jgi:hypothetical protein